MSKGSRRVYEQFLALNAELINIKQFQAMNQLAMFKILKKHDKRSGLKYVTKTHSKRILSTHVNQYFTAQAPPFLVSPAQICFSIQSCQSYCMRP
jgi:SPX domain protein involved in polyphosphate accumulation